MTYLEPTHPISAPRAVFIAFVLTTISFLHADRGFDPADEGFLWYGAIHAQAGQVPIRDFLAYAPGRYYWCAALFSLFGNGLMALRLSATLFQFLGFSAALLALRRVLKSPWALSGAGVLVLFWMIVPYRYFDSSVQLFAVLVATRLLEKPSKKRYFEAGLLTGLAAFFGLNHGLYLFTLFSGLIIFQYWKGCLEALLKNGLAYLFGFFCGSLPIMGMCIFLPGFFESYIRLVPRLAMLLALGQANIALPIPWPWTVSWGHLGQVFQNQQVLIREFAGQSALGLCFIFLIIFYFFSVPSVFFIQKKDISHKALWIASAFVGVCYLHHIFSHAEGIHFGEGFFPVIAGLLSIRVTYPYFHKKLAYFLIVLISILSFFSAGIRNNVFLKHFPPQTKNSLVQYVIGNDHIWMLKSAADRIDGLKKVVAQYVPAHEPMLLAPLMTTFYPILGKNSPVYDLFFVAPQSEETQLEMIHDLEKKKVRWAVVGNPVVRSSLGLRLSTTQPILWKYLMTNFEAVTDRGLQPGYFLMRKRSFT